MPASDQRNECIVIDLSPPVCGIWLRCLQPALPFFLFHFCITTATFRILPSITSIIIAFCRFLLFPSLWLLIHEEKFAQEMVGEPVAHDKAYKWRDKDNDEIVQTTDVSQECHTVISYALLLGCSCLEPHLDGQHRLLSVDVFFGITVPIFSRHDVFVLHARQRISQSLCLWLEDLVVWVLYLNVLFLNDSFNTFVVLEV